MNRKLDVAATAAVSAAGYEKVPGYCERFVREIIQHVYGARYNAFFKPSAKETAEAFMHDRRYVVPREQGTQVGDILFKTHGSGGFGHVGIRVTGNRVAENSHAHITDGNDHDARGFRSLREFGEFDVVVRLPE